MNNDLNQKLKKLDRPPSGPNWVRFVGTSQPETTKAILKFVKGIPKFTYLTGAAAIRDRINLGIDLNTAVGITKHRGAPAGRKQNEELVRAFFEYDIARSYPSLSFIEFEREWFRVSRDISVPVAPLTIIREKGQLVPIFLCGWSTLPLDLNQRRLLMTICEDAFLSLTDFIGSPAEFLFFPHNETPDGKIRQPEIWQRGDYNLLSTTELNRMVSLYLSSRNEARNILLAEVDKEGAVDKDTRRGPEAPDLFGKR